MRGIGLGYFFKKYLHQLDLKVAKSLLACLCY